MLAPKVEAIIAACLSPTLAVLVPALGVVEAGTTRLFATEASDIDEALVPAVTRCGCMPPSSLL